MHKNAQRILALGEAQNFAPSEEKTRRSHLNEDIYTVAFPKDSS